MAHYAQLDSNNVVISVISGQDESSEIDWEDFYTKETGIVHKRTSYNTSAGKHRLGGEPYRKNFAGIGYIYDEIRDAFIPPKPYSSWILNENTCIWESPIPTPDNDRLYSWNEEKLSWVIFGEK